MTAILYGLSVLILSCAVSWLLSRLRNGRPRRHRLLSRREMRALRRRGSNLRALENWRLDRMNIPFGQALAMGRPLVLPKDWLLVPESSTRRIMEGERPGETPSVMPVGPPNSGPLSPPSSNANPTQGPTPERGT